MGVSVENGSAIGSDSCVQVSAAISRQMQGLMYNEVSVDNDFYNNACVVQNAVATKEHFGNSAVNCRSSMLGQVGRVISLIHRFVISCSSEQ